MSVFHALFQTTLILSLQDEYCFSGYFFLNVFYELSLSMDLIQLRIVIMLWHCFNRYCSCKKSRTSFIGCFLNMSTEKENIVQKVQSPLLKNILTPELSTVTNAFQESGYEIRLVGGVVRDLLLEVQSKDIDLSTNATPEQMKEVFVRNGIRFIETGLEHGTLTAHLDNLDFEVTTLRYDTEQDGRWAKVVFTNDWKLDAERRDLTINAMSMDTNCCLYDYFGGVEDLRCRRVRFVGDAGQRIREDFLRILRYFRFYGRIATDADKHDNETLEVIREMAFGLQRIAVERIWMEMSKILIGNFAPSIMKHIYNLGVAKYIGNIQKSRCLLKFFPDLLWLFFYRF